MKKLDDMIKAFSQDEKAFEKIMKEYFPNIVFEMEEFRKFISNYGINSIFYSFQNLDKEFCRHIIDIYLSKLNEFDIFADHKIFQTKYQSCYICQEIKWTIGNDDASFCSSCIIELEKCNEFAKKYLLKCYKKQFELFCEIKNSLDFTETRSKMRQIYIDAGLKFLKLASK